MTFGKKLLIRGSDHTVCFHLFQSESLTKRTGFNQVGNQQLFVLSTGGCTFIPNLIGNQSVFLILKYVEELLFHCLIVQRYIFVLTPPNFLSVF